MAFAIETAADLARLVGVGLAAVLGACCCPVSVIPHQITIARYENVPAIADAVFDTALATMGIIVEEIDGAAGLDYACRPVRFTRVGAVATFSLSAGGMADGFINTLQEWTEVVAVPQRYKVVFEIADCGGYKLDIRGCTQNSSTVVTEPRDEALTGVVWAHEFGHSRNLVHSSDALDLMFQAVQSASRRILQAECPSFRL